MYDFINIMSGLTVAVTSVVIALATVLINWPKLKKSWSYKDVKNVRGKIDLQRRRLIKTLPYAAIGVATWGSIRFTPLYDGIKKGILSFLPKGRELVINSKNGVIHHKVLCSDHLPKNIAKTNPYKLASSSRFHSSQKVAILTDLTDGVSAEDSIEILMLAIEKNPTSVHIYDKLVKLLGKIKRYESIHLLLANAEYNLIQEAKNKEVGSKNNKKYLKAIAHIQLQREKAKMRARYSALSI